MRKKNPERHEEQPEIQHLRERLAEAEDALRAIRAGEVNALVVSGPKGDQVCTLKDTEEPYRLLVETMNEGALTLLPDSTVVYSNARFSEMVRMSLERIIGSSFLRLLSPPQQPLFTSLLERSRKERGSEEFTLMAGDGSTVPVQLSARALAGSIMGEFCLVITDLTERKRAEQERSYLASIVESSQDAIIVKSPEGVIQSWNRGAERLYGYAASEVIGRSVSLLCPPELRQEIAGFVNPIKQGKRIESLETVRVTKDGRRVDVCLTISPTRNAHGEVISASTIIRDITNRKRAEMELRQSEEHFHSLFENMLNGFAFCQMHFEHDQPQDFTYLEVNHAFERLTGLKDVVGKKVSEVIPGLHESDPDVFEMYGRVALTGKPERMETFVDALGMWFSIAAYSPKKEFFVAVFDVITERKRAEMELRRVNRALRTISAGNQAIVRATEESRLLEDICGILVQEGGYRMAWVGYAENGEGKSVRPMAHSGFEEDYLQAVNLTWADTERGRGPTGTAIRTGKPVVARNIQTEPSLAPWREEQLKRGYASSIALPIFANERVLGALTVYAEEPDAFDSAEVQLLADLADDLAYGIQTLRTKAERQRAEEALIEERHLHHTLMDNLPDWIYFKDRESRFTRINLALAEKFGLETPTQAVGKTDFDFMAAEHAREFHNDDAEILRTGQPIIGKEESGIWPDGHVTWVSATKMPLRDANGAIIGTFGVSRDITERKRFEEALRESEEKYRSLVSNIPDVSWTMDANQRFVFISNNMERLSGFSPDEVYEHGAHLYLSSLHPDDVSKVREAFRALFAEGRPYDVECRVRRKDGDWIWIHDRALATYEKEGIRYADGLLSDITERKWIEGTLRLTQFSVEHASDGTFWMNSQGQIVYANEAACRSLGYAREELLSLAIPNFDPLFKKETWETFWEEIKQRGSVTFETQHQTKQGRIFPVEVTANYVEFGGREYSFAFARDITERKRAEEALRKSESKLKEALLAAQMGVWEWTVETDTVTWDENLYRIAGRDPKMPAPSYWEHPQIYAPESWERLKAAVENALATGTPYELDLEMVCPDGSRRWLIGRGEPLRDASGRITHLRGTVQDITERKWAEEALRDGEERLAEAEHLAHIGSSSWDVATDTTKWSAELYRIMGRDPSGPTPTHQERASLYAPESWARLESAVQRALKTGEPYDLELEVARPDGTRRHVHARGAAVQGDDGRIVRLHGTLQDVTERKRTEEDLALFKHSIDVHYDGAYWADTNNRFIYFNDAGCKALGYEREELIGKTVFEISPEASPEGLKRLWKGLRNQGFFSMESVHRRKDGSEYPVDLVISYVQSAGKEFACGFARDITERKRAEAESADRLRFETLLADLSARFVHVPAEQIDSEIKDAQRRVCESLALDACSLWQVMPETPGFIPLTHIYRPSEGSPIPAGINAGQYLPWSTQQILAGKVIVASSLEELPVEAARDCQTFSFFGIKSVLTLALSVGGGPVVGGLAFSTRKERTWPEELVKHLRVVAELFCSALERQRAERALRESEERFRSLFENATVGIYRTTPEGRILMANKTLVRMLGYEHFDDLAARNLEVDGFEPGYPRRLFREQIEKGGEVRGMEEAWTRLDGSEIFVRESARTIRSGDGLILYYDGIVEDITERKRAEEALRLTQFSVEHASDAILWMDSEGQIVYVNGAACRALERSREELLSLSITNIEPHFSKEDWEKFWNEIKLRGSMTFETEHQTKQGRVFPVEVTANYVGFGGKEYSFAFARDISGRKQGEAEHLRLVTAIEQSAEAVVITNTAGDIEYVNPAFTRITGYSREEALGQNPRILKSGKQEASLYQQLWATILQGKTWRGEISNQRKDGSLYTLQMSIAPVRGEHGEITHFIATEEDVTARKQLEQQFTQAQKMEAIGRLAGGVAHDFNNLLTIINGYSELLLEKLGSEHAASGYLKEIKGAGDRAASLTRQLLAFSRRQVLAPQVLNLNVVIANLEKMLTRLIGEDIKLHTILGPSLAPVKADPGQIEQVLMNLAVNARDAMPSGGNLTIETSDVELDENYADSHPTVQPGPHVMLAVVDTGTGMTPETKARIFEPFFTTKEKGKGTGLGLATVYGIVKQSGGSIWVYSELGQGTVFKIYLPAVSELPVEKGHAKAEMGPAFGTETILVIEDEEGVRTLVRHALESRGYKVLETDDAEEAVALCTNHEGTIHLLMTDVVMPKMSGPAVAERVTALRPGIKVLYMSGYTDDAVVRHGILTQDMPFLQKPFSPAALRKKIREVLGG